MTEDGIAYKCKKCKVEYSNVEEAKECYQSHKEKQKTTLYLHCNKESNYDKGEELGLTDDALYLFSGALYEVEFDLHVDPEGTYEILEVRCGGQILRPYNPILEQFFEPLKEIWDNKEDDEAWNDLE